MAAHNSEELKTFQERFRAENQTCFILGASGETGKELLAEILQQQLFSRVTLIGRRKLNLEGPLYANVVGEQSPCLMRYAELSTGLCKHLKFLHS